LTSSTDANGNTWTYTNDTLGHRLTATDPDGNTTHYAYSTSTGLMTTITDAASHVTDTLAYDSYRRQTSDTDYNGHANSETYDSNGNVASATDKNSHTTSFTNDALGR